MLGSFSVCMCLGRGLTLKAFLWVFLCFFLISLPCFKFKSNICKDGKEPSYHKSLKFDVSLHKVLNCIHVIVVPWGLPDMYYAALLILSPATSHLSVDITWVHNVINILKISSYLPSCTSTQCKHLNLYKEYVEMYRRSLDCLKKCRSDNVSFEKFLEVSVYMVMCWCDWYGFFL